MSDFLVGRRILFIGIGFYDYESYIKEYLQKLGAVVEYHLQEPRWHQMAMLRRIATRLGMSLDKSRSKYHAKLLKQVAEMPFDDVFVIKGDSLSQDFIVSLKQKNPGARFIQYQWDSVKRVPNAMQMAKLFDQVYSFDRFDCNSIPGFRFRPLFYRGAPVRLSEKLQPKYDLVFIGWLHANRLVMTMDLAKHLKTSGKKTYFFLFTGVYTYLKAWFSGNSENLSIKKLSYSEVDALMSSAKCVLDIPHPDQTGLTIRTIETLGKNCKLVTTNPDVVNYDFYNPSNVLYLQSLDADKIAHFLDVPFEPVDDGLLAKYSINRWINEVFS